MRIITKKLYAMFDKNPGPRKKKAGCGPLDKCFEFGHDKKEKAPIKFKLKKRPHGNTPPPPPKREPTQSSQNTRNLTESTNLGTPTGEDDLRKIKKSAARGNEPYKVASDRAYAKSEPVKNPKEKVKSFLGIKIKNKKKASKQSMEDGE